MSFALPIAVLIASVYGYIIFHNILKKTPEKTFEETVVVTLMFLHGLTGVVALCYILDGISKLV